VKALHDSKVSSSYVPSPQRGGGPR
jgi:hypothetical protein